MQCQSISIVEIASAKFNIFEKKKIEIKMMIVDYLDSRTGNKIRDNRVRRLFADGRPLIQASLFGGSD